MVLPDSNGISRAPLYSGYTSEEIYCQLQGCYLLWLTLPCRFISHTSLLLRIKCPTAPTSKLVGLGYVPFRSPLLRKSLLLSLPPDTKMFQFSGYASSALCIQTDVLFY